MAFTRSSTAHTVTIPDPPFAHALFNTTRFAWLWTLVRVYLGYAWLSSGWGKVTGGTWASGDASKASGCAV